MKKAVIAMLVTGMAVSPVFAFANEGADKTKMVEEHMKKIDTNGDGMISMAEYQAASNKMFTEADTNGDKMISRDEMIAMEMKKKEKMKEKTDQ